MALTDYINTKITDEQIRKKLKTVAQKKAYVSNVPGLDSQPTLSRCFWSLSSSHVGSLDNSCSINGMVRLEILRCWTLNCSRTEWLQIQHTVCQWVSMYKCDWQYNILYTLLNFQQKCRHLAPWRMTWEQKELSLWHHRAPRKFEWAAVSLRHKSAKKSMRTQPPPSPSRRRTSWTTRCR